MHKVYHYDAEENDKERGGEKERDLDSTRLS